MEVYKAKISRKGQVAIPKKIRDKLASDIVDIVMVDDKVILTPAESILTIGASLNKYAAKLKAEKKSQQESEIAWERHVRKKFNAH